MRKPLFKSLGTGFFVVLLAACQTTKPSATTAPTSSTVTATPADSAEAEAADTTQPSGPPVWAAKKHQYNPSRLKASDLVHTKLDVRFDWQKQHVNGVATITLKPHFYPQDSLVLDAKGFDISSVQLYDEKTRKGSALKYDYNNQQITIRLDRTYKRDEQYTVRVTYTAKPNELPKGGSEAISGDKGLYFINPDGADPNKPKQIWTQGETQDNSAWFPTIDSPNQKTTQEIYITVDSKYITLSNGTLQYSRTNSDGTRTDYWKQDKPHAPYLVMMAVGEYAIVKDKWKNLEVNYYVEPKYEKYAKAIFGRTPEMLEFFSNKLGIKYQWDKYSQIVVRDYVSGAMENTSATVFMEDLQVDDRTLLDEHWDYIIAHELFHHWFGDLVTAESWSNLPLNESFANYSEYLWNEYKYGVDEADYKGQDELDQYLGEAENKQEPLIRYHYHDREEMFDSHSYAKGGRILHMLRKYVGDEAFFQALNQYLQKHQYGTAEVHDLRLAFEAVTGEDLNWFFNQWFLSAGHAQLKVEQAYANGKVRLQVTQLQDSTYTPIYKLPLKVDVWVGGKKTRHQVWVDKASQTLEFAAASKPDLVIFDAERQLVGLIDHEKSTEELVFQYYHAEKFLSKQEALTKLGKQTDNQTVRKMMFDAMNDPFWKLRQIAVSNFGSKGAELAADLKEKAIKLAESDPRSYVRAEALALLATSAAKETYVDLYRKKLEDPSYTVVATALYAYLITDPADAKAQVAKFETVDNKEVVSTVAAYYAETADSAKYDWFAKQLGSRSGTTLYQLTQAFGQYLMKQSPALQQQGSLLLGKLARDHSTYYVRFAAFQALSLLNETDDIKKMREDIREKETDPRLKNYYDMMK